MQRLVSTCGLLDAAASQPSILIKANRNCECSLHVSDRRLEALDESLVARLLLAEDAQVARLERVADEVVVHSHLLPHFFHQVCVVHGDGCSLHARQIWCE